MAMFNNDVRRCSQGVGEYEVRSGCGLYLHARRSVTCTVRKLLETWQLGRWAKDVRVLVLSRAKILLNFSVLEMRRLATKSSHQETRSRLG